MNFRVNVIIEIPIIDEKYELLVPIDRRIHELISILKKAIPDLNKGFYQDKIPSIYNKSTGKVYNINTIIKNSNIKTGTRLVLI